MSRPKISRQQRRALTRAAVDALAKQLAGGLAPAARPVAAPSGPGARPADKAPGAPGAPVVLARRAGIRVGDLDREPSTQMRRLWDPDRVRLAEAHSDWGNLELVAELCDAMLGDGDIRSAIEKRVRAVYRAKLTFSPGKGRRKRSAAKAMEAEDDWWTIVPESEFCQWAMWALLLGVSLAQIEWPDADAETGRRVPTIRFWHPRTLRFDIMSRRWLVRTENRGEVDLGDKAEAGRWLMLAPYGSNRPWASGLWRSLWPWYLLTTYAVIDWGEASGSDSIKVITEETSPQQGPLAGPSGYVSTTSKLRQDLHDVVAAMGARGSIALPPGYSLDLLSQPANTHQKYVDQIGVSAKQKDVVILGTDMASRGEDSNRATGQTGESILCLYASSDAETYATVLYELLKLWALANFGDTRAAVWPNWQTQKPLDLKLRAEGIGLLATAVKASREVGAPIDARALYEEYEVPTLEPKRDAAGKVDPWADVNDSKFYQYHLEFGIATADEYRTKLGLVAWGGEKGEAIPTKVADPNAAPAAGEVGGEGGGGGAPGGKAGTPPRGGGSGAPKSGGGSGSPAPGPEGGKAGSGGGGKADPNRPSQGAEKADLGRVPGPLTLARSAEGPAIEGLAYCDAVTDAALRVAPRVLAAVVEGIAEALGEGDYEACRARLLELAGADPPPALHRLLGQVAAMAAAAGAYSGSVEDPYDGPADGEGDPPLTGPGGDA